LSEGSITVTCSFLDHDWGFDLCPWRTPLGLLWLLWLLRVRLLHSLLVLHLLLWLVHLLLG
jgi:hypothetical protein